MTTGGCWGVVSHLSTLYKWFITFTTPSRLNHLQSGSTSLIHIHQHLQWTRGYPRQLHQSVNSSTTERACNEDDKYKSLGVQCFLSCQTYRSCVNICSGLGTALASIIKPWLNYASCPVWSIVLEVKLCLCGVGTTLARFIPGSFNFWAWSNGINIWCTLTSSGWSLNYFSVWSIDRVFDFNIRSFLLCIVIASFKSPSKDPQLLYLNFC